MWSFTLATERGRYTSGWCCNLFLKSERELSNSEISANVGNLFQNFHRIKIDWFYSDLFICLLFLEGNCFVDNKIIQMGQYI